METTRACVRLRDVEPAVVRVLDVPATVQLQEFHHLLQAGLGWTDSHLHQFVTDDALYGMVAIEPPEDERDESGVPLRKLPVCFRYLYDFGDGWEHDVELLGAGGDRPGCVYGEGSCPPEDCGGPHGYAELRAVLADPTHEDHAAMRTWAGDLADFDQAATDLLVHQTAGAVPEPVRLVLELAADGVKLTPGGRLPRWLVREVQARRPDWHPLGDPASREDDLPPLVALHDLLRDVGLLRLRKGVVAPIKAASDDVEVVRRLRSWFAPQHGFTAVLAGVSVAVLAAGSGAHRADELVAQVYPLLGHGWATRDGQPMTEEHVRMGFTGLVPELCALDLIDDDPGGWHAGPSARWLLPRATVLAYEWSGTP
ncbi:MAG: plasmid pRiA4b ORF-3 family protein [Streptosporangiales bacterium]